MYFDKFASSLSLFVAVLFLVVGCTNHTGSKCYPVRGTIRYNGMPLAEAMILFHPLDHDAPEIARPLAFTDRNGNFALTSIQPNDGAPPGEYAMTVELRELKPDGDQMVRDGRNLLPEKYRDPKASGLHFIVEPEPNEVPVIDLKSE